MQASDVIFHLSGRYGIRANKLPVVARNLRVKGDGLWPSSAKRGAGVHVGKRQLTNLILGYAVGEPVVDCAEIVQKWRAAGDVDLTAPLDLDRFAPWQQQPDKIIRTVQLPAALLAELDEIAEGRE